jgi:CPA2 family monovalent cation:H+ antiporter-2
MGLEYETRETIESALMFGRRTLEALGTDEDQAYEISQDVRKRDEERLAIQAVDGITAGIEKMRLKPVTPEPLVKPTRESKRLDSANENDPQAGDEDEVTADAN